MWGEYSTLALAQDGDQWSATRCGRITSGGNVRGIHELRRWEGATGGIKDLGNKTNAFVQPSNISYMACSTYEYVEKYKVYGTSYILDRHLLS